MAGAVDDPSWLKLVRTSAVAGYGFEAWRTRLKLVHTVLPVARMIEDLAASVRLLG